MTDSLEPGPYKIIWVSKDPPLVRLETLALGKRRLPVELSEAETERVSMEIALLLWKADNLDEVDDIVHVERASPHTPPTFRLGLKPP